MKSQLFQKSSTLNTSQKTESSLSKNIIEKTTLVSNSLSEENQSHFLSSETKKEILTESSSEIQESNFNEMKTKSMINQENNVISQKIPESGKRTLTTKNGHPEHLLSSTPTVEKVE